LDKRKPTCLELRTPPPYNAYTHGIDSGKLKKRKRSAEEISQWFEDGLKLVPVSSDTV
jgi:hypothetical protein